MAPAATCSTPSRAPTSARPAGGSCSTSTSPTTRRARTTRAGAARSRRRRTAWRSRCAWASATSPRELLLVVTGVRELRAEKAVPHAVGHQRALADEQAGGRRDAVADLRRARRDRALDRAGDGLGAAAEPGERALLVDALRRAGDRRVERRVRALDRRARRHGAGGGVGEAGLDDPRLDDHDVDAEVLDLEAQGVADRLDRVLRRVVEAAAREREVRAHRRDVDDPPVALGAHPGQHELAHPHEPEDVRLELAADLVERDLLVRARLAVAGVVDER